MSDGIKGMVRIAASRWNSYGTFTESSSGVGSVNAYADPNTSTMAKFYNCSTNSYGHLLAWSIGVNIAKSTDADDVAHEFGHAWGMNDLYEPYNINKIMYGWSGCTATYPSSSDGKGMMVITGVHSTHTFTYSYYGNGQHRKICSVCEGYKIENCTISGGSCIYCHY